MGFKDKPYAGRHGLPAGLIAVILGMILYGGVTGPLPALAATISCGGCHGDTASQNPMPSGVVCSKETSKSHPAHADGTQYSTCTRCHPDTQTLAPTLVHDNNVINITSVVSSGMRYNTTTYACAGACHKNQDNSVWGENLNCNSCHFRSGAFGGKTPSGLHAVAGRTWAHYSSSIKVTDNTRTITCSNCHTVFPNDTTAPRTHINAVLFENKANMSNAHSDVSVTGVGYTKGAAAADGTCTSSCHYNGDDTFGNKTTYFRTGVKKRFGGYSTSKWGATDLRCNECHSSPSQEASYTGVTSTYGNKHHDTHMFKYKLSLSKFKNDDQNVYCYDCHRYPELTGTRTFKNHSTTGQGGSGVISLPVKSGNAKVNLRWRNNNIGQDGKTAPAYNSAAKTCDNVYCHTALVSATWTDKGCNECHGVKDGVLAGSGAPGYRNWTTASTYPAFEDYPGGGGAHYLHIYKRGYPCRTCHNNGGTDGNRANHNQGGGTVTRANVNVGIRPEWAFKGGSPSYDTTTRVCSNVKCHYGTSKGWDCEPLH